MLFVHSFMSAQDEWIKFDTDLGQSFTVDAPGELFLKTKEISTALGVLESYTYAYQEEEKDVPNYLYVINIIDYPEETFPDDSLVLIADFLDQSLLSINDGVGGTLVYDSPINDKKNGVGRIFRIKYNEDYAILKGKLFLKGDKFISLQVFTTKEKSLNSEMDKFLNSFKLRS